MEIGIVFLGDFQASPDDPRVGPVSGPQYQHYSHCYRCRTNWGLVKWHSTQVTEYHGLFPLCELCWGELAPEERLPFYRQLYARWGPYPDLTWPEIESAVLAEGRS